MTTCMDCTAAMLEVKHAHAQATNRIMIQVQQVFHILPVMKLHPLRSLQPGQG